MHLHKAKTCTDKELYDSKKTANKNSFEFDGDQLPRLLRFCLLLTPWLWRFCHSEPFFFSLFLANNTQVRKGTGSQLVVVCVAKYPGGKSPRAHSRFYRGSAKAFRYEISSY